MLGFKTGCHLITNEVARLTIASDIRFNELVDTIGEDKVKSNHTRAKDIKEGLFGQELIMDSLDEYTQWFENLPEEAQLYWEYDWFCESIYDTEEENDIYQVCRDS